MFFGSTTEQTRQFFFDAWRKFRQQQPLSSLEKQLVDVIGDHPEYHAYLDGPADRLADFTPEQGQSNPFLHMGLHLALREQININRPPGVADIYQKLVAKHPPLEAEHLMMDCLAETLWSAQRHQQEPDVQSYLENLRKIRNYSP